MSMEDAFEKALSGLSGGTYSQLIIKQLKGEAAEIDRRVNGAISELCFDIIDATPVGLPETWSQKWRSIRGVEEGRYQAGHLRQNWQFSNQSMPTAELDGTDPSGSGAKSDVLLGLEGFGNTYYFFNTAPYAEDIEYGWSSQAPYGMLRSGLAAWPSIASKWRIV